MLSPELGLISSILFMIFLMITFIVILSRLSTLDVKVDTLESKLNRITALKEAEK